MLKQPFYHHKFTKYNILTTILKATMKVHLLTPQSHACTQMIVTSPIPSLDYCVTTPQLLNLNESSHLNAQPTTQIHVSQFQSNEMSHDYHVENGLPNEVIDHFRDNEDEILVVNNDDNINNNDNNDIQFLSKPTTTENVYHSYPNCTDVGDNQVIENFDYMHFLDLPQQSKSQDGELYVGQ